MLEEIDAFDFVLAEKLHKSLGEIREMPNSEHVEWRAWFKARPALEMMYGNR